MYVINDNLLDNAIGIKNVPIIILDNVVISYGLSLYAFVIIMVINRNIITRLAVTVTIVL